MDTAPDRDTARAGGRARRAAQVAAGLGCAGLLAWLVDWRASLALLARAAPAEAAAVGALAALGIAVCAWKWQRLLAVLSVRAPLPELLRIYWAAAFVGTFLPSTVPGDAARVVLTRRFGDAATVIASIAAERVTGLATLLLLASGAALARPDLLPGGPPRSGLVAVAAAGSAILLAFAPAALAKVLGRRWRFRGVASLGRFGAAVADIARRPGALQVAVALSAVFYAAVALSHYAALRAFGVEVGLADVAVVALLVTLAAALPVSPNGLGVGEAAFVLLYAQVGVPPEQALAAALLRRVIVTLVCLAGAIPWFAARDRGRPAAGGAAGPGAAPLVATPPPRRLLLGQLLADLPRSPRPLGAYLAGCVCFSLGVTCLDAADLGIDPLHAMAIAIVDAVGLPHVQVGLVVSAATLAMLAGWAAWLGRLPPLSVFVTMALTAYLVDAWRLLAADAWLRRSCRPRRWRSSASPSTPTLGADRHERRRIRVVDLVALASSSGSAGTSWRARRRSRPPSSPGVAPGRPAGRRDARVPAPGRPVHGADDVGQRPLPGTAQPRRRPRPVAPLAAGAAGLIPRGWPARRTRAPRPPHAVRGADQSRPRAERSAPPAFPSPSCSEPSSPTTGRTAGCSCSTSAAPCSPACSSSGSRWP
jgi:uncharacterized membrane protein YbhN (UPF0104 family)